MWQNIFDLPSKDGNKRVNRDNCSFATKQHMFGIFSIDELLCYRWSRIAGWRTLCHPALYSKKKHFCCLLPFIDYFLRQVPHQPVARVLSHHQRLLLLRQLLGSPPDKFSLAVFISNLSNLYCNKKQPGRLLLHLLVLLSQAADLRELLQL